MFYVICNAFFLRTIFNQSILIAQNNLLLESLSATVLTVFNCLDSVQLSEYAMVCAVSALVSIILSYLRNMLKGSGSKVYTEAKKI